MRLLGALLSQLFRRRPRGRRMRLVDRGELDALRLKACRLQDCGGACCARGARVSAREAKRITRLMTQHPELFTDLPRLERYLVPRDALGQPGMYSTEVVSRSSHGMKGLQAARVAGSDPGPGDMVGAHCAFRFDDGRCSLQAAAEALGEHKWEYKPLGCWLFPLKARVVEKAATHTLVCLEHAAKSEPVLADAPCARPQADGRPARELLAEEIRFFVRRACEGG